MNINSEYCFPWIKNSKIRPIKLGQKSLTYETSYRKKVGIHLVSHVFVGENFGLGGSGCWGVGGGRNIDLF